MEENNTQPTPNFEGEEMKMPENMDSSTASQTEESNVINAPLLAFLAILLVAILGGMYYWFSTLSVEPIPVPAPVERPTPEENNEPESTTAEAQVEALLTTSPSDEVSAIEADIEATNFEELDAELNAIDAELEAALQ